MSFILKPFKVIRNHWKKSIFFTGVAAYGLNWANETRKEESIRTDYCQRAKTYGDQTIASAFDKPQSVLVLLNRNAGNNKAKSLFDKNCAPILHLAGFDIQTEDWDGSSDPPAIAKLDKLLSDPQKQYAAVLVVGGNRTVNAFVNYSVNHQAQGPVPPAAFVPVGQDSIVMTRFIPLVGSTATVRRLCDVTFKVVQGQPETVDVLRIESSDDGKPSNDVIYAISSFAFDKVTDTSHKSYKYWYLPAATKRIFVGLMGLAMGSFSERIIGDIDAVHEDRPPVSATKPLQQPKSSGGWFGKKSEPAPVAPAVTMQPLKAPVRTGRFDADYFSMSANHPHKQGSFLVEVSTQHQSQFSAFLATVAKNPPSIEDSFNTTELTLTLKLIPRHCALYVDGVPYLDFERILKVSIVPSALKMFY